ncbi:thiamine phosphate synthase [Edaphobacter sp. 12200R-103]|uniref:thiamine phosphate synthase n=1 Tax=Edaphobacter sp. 12200R-103 TaxID=2703788 RepID=UPI00138DC173|nr:thiamine phosphate synthase [Edaphobacter sp. 12200R-103]QHS53290.1 thiamine phosphate synthase [Edaphobacter sp. 12200R-103]
MLRCAITDRSLFAGDESQKQLRLLENAVHWVRNGIDLIQLREKDLPPATQVELAIKILQIIATESSPTRLILNAAPFLALEVKAHGVHLPSHSPLRPGDIRRRYLKHHLPLPIVTVSCHNLAEVQIARRNHADAILFAPVFGKTIDGQLVTPATGLEILHDACLAAAPIPVYALGGVTEENASQCIAAGAAGVAGIRLFLR